MFRQLTPSFLQLHASIYPMQIFLQLQHWLGQPFVQPQVVISLQACGICGRERSHGTSWPSECIHPISVTGEDQDAVSGPGSKHFVVGTHDVEFCCIRCRRQIPLYSTNTKQLDSCIVACINLRNAIHLTDEFLCQYHCVFNETSLPKFSEIQAAFLPWPPNWDTLSQPVTAWNASVSIWSAEST